MHSLEFLRLGTVTTHLRDGEWDWDAWMERRGGGVGLVDGVSVPRGWELATYMYMCMYFYRCSAFRARR